MMHPPPALQQLRQHLRSVFTSAFSSASATQQRNVWINLSSSSSSSSSNLLRLRQGRTPQCRELSVRRKKKFEKMKVPFPNKVRSLVPLDQRKQVWLPDFNITLLRPPRRKAVPTMPPNYAMFSVPLNLSKLDLKDFLLRGYGVMTRHVRSYVQQQRISKHGSPRQVRPSTRRWHRPRAQKRMVVCMEEGFVWPEEVSRDELENSWNRTMFAEGEKAQAERGKELEVGWMKDRFVKVGDRRSMREQAEEMLMGQGRVWRPTWHDYGFGMRREDFENNLEHTNDDDENSGVIAREMIGGSMEVGKDDASDQGARV